MQVSPADEGDDKATFLAEFRTLRDRAAIDCEELAARAHFPTDVIKAAEKGPELPGLPVLAAYVRACGGDVLEWEERWRRLASDTDIDSGLPMRPAGASPAAVAGARAGVTIASADAHDPERIKAALRAHREREELTGHGRATAHQDIRPSSGITTPAGGPATMIANGNHHKKPHPDGFNAWTPPTPEEPRAEPATRPWTRDDPASRLAEPRETHSAEPAEPQEGRSAEPRQTHSAEPREAWDSAAQTEAAPESDVWTPSRSRTQGSRTQKPPAWTPDPPAWAEEPPARAEEPSVWRREPSAWADEPPAWTEEPSVWQREPPARADEPPAWTEEPSVWQRQPSVPAAEQTHPMAGVSGEPVPAAPAAEATGRAGATGSAGANEKTVPWGTPAISESGTAKPPVAAIRAAASEAGASQVTVAQAAAATSANRRGKQSGHKALLVLLVLVIIIGCIALLSLT